MLDTLPLTVADKRRVLGLSFADGKGGKGEGRGGEGGEGGEGEGEDAGGGGAGGGVLRVSMLPDAGAPAPFAWLVDVEKDAAFAKWPSDLRGLLQPTWQLHQLRRNLYSALLVMPLAQQASLRALHTLTALKQMRVPIRSGVLVLPVGSPEDAAALGAAGPLPAPAPAAPATSLHLALLHAAATARWGAGAGGNTFLEALAGGWAAAATAAAAAAGGGAEGGGAAAMMQPDPALAPDLTVEDALVAWGTLGGGKGGSAAARRESSSAREG